MFFGLFSKQQGLINFLTLVYSAVIAGKEKVGDDIYLRLFENIKDTHNQYTNKIIKNTKEKVARARKDVCGIDFLLKEILNQLKMTPGLEEKINFASLRNLIDDEDIVAFRVFDFLVEEVKECERKKLF